VSRSDLYEFAPFDPVEEGYSNGCLPYYVAPAHEEALVSWLARLARRLGVSVQMLVRSAGITADFDVDSPWWFRPEPTMIARIAARSGVQSSRLREMTFAEWAPAIRNDEAIEAFSASPQRFTVRKITQPLVVCTQCLREDRDPYLRLSWMLGWIGLCPIHKSVLTSCCPQCRFPLRVPELTSVGPYPLHRCGRCNTELLGADAHPAHEQAVRLQAALLEGKRQGMAELGDLEPIPWSVAVAVLGTLFELVWIGPPARHRARLYSRVRRDLGLSRGLGLGEQGSRYGNLLLTAWLLDRWPRNLRSGVSILRSSPVNTLIGHHHDLNPATRVRLQELFQPVNNKPSRRRKSWRAWLDELPHTGEELRARACREALEHRRIRLIALAGLRDDKSVKEVAAAIRYQPETVSRWLREGATNGLEAMLERSRGLQMLSSAQVAELAQWLVDSPPRGTPGFSVLQRSDVIAEAMKRFGVEITGQVASRLLRMYSKSWRGRRLRPYPIRVPNSRITEPIHDKRPRFAK
jgi:hypothetical protein